MSDDRIVEQFKLLKRAKKLEELGSTDRALDLYLELHEKYDPNTSDAYERPAIILERKKKYKEALAFCEKAIEEIEQDKISGTKEKFEKRIQHINDKLKDAPERVKHVTHNAYKFGIIGFRSKNKLKIITSSVYYLLSLLLGALLKSPFIAMTLIGFIYLFNYFFDFFKADKKYKFSIALLLLISLALVIYSSLQLPKAFDELINLEDAEATLEGGEAIYKEDAEKPLITEQHLSDARSVIESEIEVIESVIIVNQGTITLGLLLQPQTNKEKAISLSESFAEILAHQVSKDNDIKAPSFNSLGELYDYYSLLISAGSDGNTLIAKGTKSTSQKYITWRE